MLRITVLGIWARRRRLVRLVSAVGLGVAFLAGTFVLGDTLRHSYQSGFSSARSGVGAVIKSETTLSAAFGLPARTMLLDGGLADRIGGVAGVEPTIEGYAAIQGSDGKILGGRGSAPVGGAIVRTRGGFAASSEDSLRRHRPEPPRRRPAQPCR